ncbi:MAG: PEP-CTERM sorting domain-containing protein [Bryobacterales bacterium]|nr:PEP-CTERM sorting domain-containing protein [Bryobacterales bacterium]
MPIQFFGTVSFNITDPSSFTFGNGVFGTFTATSLITRAPNPPGFINFVYDGLWTPGTQGGLTGGPFPSSLNITFVQAAGPGSPITSNASFSVEEAETVIPEPSSFVLTVTGLAAGVLIYRRRRQNVQTGPASTVI